MLYNDLSLLIPAMETKVRSAMDAMRADAELRDLGLTDLHVNETKRDLVIQMAYYARGRMDPRHVQAMYEAAGLPPIAEEDTATEITWTLKSRHLRGEAVDIYPKREGEIWYEAPAEVWNRMGELGEAQGLTWGGRWKERDLPHYQL